MKSIINYIPKNAEMGVGLNILEEDHHLFYLPGDRHDLSPDESFYAGIGGHMEENESLLDCAQREAIEEIGVPVKVMSSLKTYYLPHNKSEIIKEIEINDNPQPYALYEMIYPEGTPHQGNVYYIIIYKAELIKRPKRFKKDEVKAIIGLTKEQIDKSLQRKPTIQKLLNEGALFIGNKNEVQLDIKVYPIGTAKAIAKIIVNDMD